MNTSNATSSQINMSHTESVDGRAESATHIGFGLRLSGPPGELLTF